MLECEKAKIELNSEQEVSQFQVRVPEFHGNYDLDISVSQQMFESLVTPYLEEKL